jgi:hypothetical protein
MQKEMASPASWFARFLSIFPRRYVRRSEIRPSRSLWALRFCPTEPPLDRMDRELKAELVKRSLYVLDETMVARCARRPVGKSVCPLSRGSMVKSDSFYSFQFKEMARPA